MKTDLKNKPGLLPPYNVVLLNDNEHTYEYVIQLLRKVFAYPEERDINWPARWMSPIARSCSLRTRNWPS